MGVIFCEVFDPWNAEVCRKKWSFSLDILVFAAMMPLHTKTTQIHVVVVGGREHILSCPLCHCQK